MKHISFLIVAMFFTTLVTAQPVVKVEVSADTIKVGEMVEVTYTIENGEGKFNMPDMNDLPVISGPNSSSSFVYQNGKTSSNQSYSFTLLAVEEGNIVVPATTYQMGGENQIIEAVKIVVLASDSAATPSKNNAASSGSKATREKKKI